MDKFALETQIHAVGGRVTSLETQRQVQYPFMMEREILEIIALHHKQKELNIEQFDDMKMLREHFENPPKHNDEWNRHFIMDTDGEYTFNALQNDVLVSEKTYKYIESLKTSEDKEYFLVIEHVPPEEITNIEALICSFGEITSLKEYPGCNDREKILLVKMESPSESSWVVSCLDEHLWANNILKAVRLDTLFNSKLYDTRSPTKIEHCIKLCRKFDDLGISSYGKELIQHTESECKEPLEKNEIVYFENELGASQYLNLPSICTLSSETIFIFKTQYNYLDFLETLEDKEYYIVIEHIPSNGVESLENLILTFGTTVLFHVNDSCIEEERIALIKMSEPSQCESIISCLNKCRWNENTLTARKVLDILSHS